MPNLTHEYVSMIDTHSKEIRFFRKQILRWHFEENTRTLVWKNEQDPYKIWVSEVMLQQTRADQVLTFYTNFINRFPSIQSLADAEEQEVFKYWQGLGYYSRCRNLIQSAKYIHQELKGTFPSDYFSILKLKGVGKYTAAAIASFAFEQPFAVLDGNVYRVLARFMAIDIPIDTPQGQGIFSALAQQCLDKDKPSAYNQAIMDFGATICTPKNPNCTECPLIKTCKAYQQELISLLPIKSKKLKIRKRYFHFFVLKYKDTYAIQLRNEKDIWQDLYQFPMLETQTEELIDSNQEVDLFLKEHKIRSSVNMTFSYQQKLSHQMIYSKFYFIECSKKLSTDKYIWITKQQFKAYPFPKTLTSFINAFIL